MHSSLQKSLLYKAPCTSLLPLLTPTQSVTCTHLHHITCILTPYHTHITHLHIHKQTESHNSHAQLTCHEIKECSRMTFVFGHANKYFRTWLLVLSSGEDLHVYYFAMYIHSCHFEIWWAGLE